MTENDPSDMSNNSTGNTKTMHGGDGRVPTVISRKIPVVHPPPAYRTAAYKDARPGSKHSSDPHPGKQSSRDPARALNLTQPSAPATNLSQTTALATNLTQIPALAINLIQIPALAENLTQTPALDIIHTGTHTTQKGVVTIVVIT